MKKEENMSPTPNPGLGRFLRVSVALLLAVFLAAPVVSAQESKRRLTPEERLEKTMTELKELLALSEEQQALVRTFFQDYYGKLQALRDTHGGKGSRERKKYREERQSLREELEAKLNTALTGEQMKKYRAYQEERRKEMRKKRSGRKEEAE
jgi:hypothetical protein